MVLGGRVRTIVSTPSTGAKPRDKDLKVNKVPTKALTMSKGNKLQVRQGLGTPGSDHRA